MNAPRFAAEYAYDSFVSYYYYGNKACLSFTAQEIAVLFFKEESVKNQAPQWNSLRSFLFNQKFAQIWTKNRLFTRYLYHYLEFCTEGPKVGLLAEDGKGKVT